MTLLGVIPGMPNLVFLGMAAVCAAGAYFLSKRKASDKAAAAAPAAAAAVPAEQRELSWDDVEAVDLIGLEVGYRLIPLVDRNQGGELMGRIKGVRKKLSEELGFLVQAVHIRDNLELGPNSYRITILGAPVGESEVFPDRELAINPGQVSGTLPGSATKDPAFGLDAVWIEKSRREQAQAQGYTVVDASSVIATHLSHLLQSHAHELLGHEEVQQLLNRLAKSAPKLIEDLVPKLLPMSVVVKVLQYLLLGARADPQPAHHLRNARRTCAEDPGPGGAGSRRTRRARPQHRAEHRRAAPGAAGHHPGSGARTGAAGFDGVRRGSVARLRARSRRPDPAGARRQHAAPRSGGRAGRAAGCAENPSVDRALDAPFDPIVGGACLQRNPGEPPHPRHCGGWTMNLLDSWRFA